MRLGQWDLTDITNKILKDLYGAKKAQFKERGSEFARKNRELWIAQFKDKLDGIPEDLLTKHKEYVLEIRYPWGIETSQNHYGDTPDEVREQWQFTSNNAVLNPIESSRSYTSPKSQPPHEELMDDIEKLCIEMIEVQKEEAETKAFLLSTTNKFKGSQKLKDLWPSAFHKYLPVEPPRAKRKKKPEEDPNIPSVPSALKTRLTTNLIEGGN